ncbi:MAG: GNAT family N-acetyltransferase [Clostridiales bacterium]|nr:GNAT family N-acetyltransferase [Clostridiales bacterium]
MKVIKVASDKDIKDAAMLADMLWPGHEEGELKTEFEMLVSDPENELFIALCNEKAVGFAHVSIRHDYVEGTSSSPVGYLEGIYVLPDHRRQKCAFSLLSACESWAKEKGCTEFASDMEEGNELSYAFHMGAGFTEANRIVCFAKKL